MKCVGLHLLSQLPSFPYMWLWFPDCMLPVWILCPAFPAGEHLGQGISLLHLVPGGWGNLSYLFLSLAALISPTQIHFEGWNRACAYIVSKCTLKFMGPIQVSIILIDATNTFLIQIAVFNVFYTAFFPSKFNWLSFYIQWTNTTNSLVFLLNVLGLTAIKYCNAWKCNLLCCFIN